MGSNTSTRTVEVPERTAEQPSTEAPAQAQPQQKTKTPRFSITLVSSVPS